VGFSGRNTSDPPNLALSRTYKQFIARSRVIPEDLWSVERLVKVFFGLNYAAYETRFRWILSAHDDMIPDVSLIGDFVKKLDGQYNPLTDFVVQSACAVLGEPFLVGSVGMLLSRFAAQKISRRFAEVSANCSVETAENMLDIRITQLLPQFDFDPPDIQNTAFLGVKWHPLSQSLLDAGNFSLLPACPPTLNQEGCRRSVAPVSDIVFHHQKDEPSFESHLKYLRELKSVSPYLSFYMAEWHEAALAKLCWNENKEEE
jgi:hypothetical protein